MGGWQGLEELLCLMYVAFQQIKPSLDLGLPFDRPYRLAMQMLLSEN